MKKELQLQFKEQIRSYCLRVLEARSLNATRAMAEAQEAANSNDKNSAGDKYETSRAMGQLDRDMNARQLAEVQQELNALLKLNTGIVSGIIGSGSVVETDQGIYFIGAGIGMIELNKQKVAVLSPKAPLALIMSGKKKGETFEFNQKKYHISNVY